MHVQSSSFRLLLLLSLCLSLACLVCLFVCLFVLFCFALFCFLLVCFVCFLLLVVVLLFFVFFFVCLQKCFAICHRFSSTVRWNLNAFANIVNAIDNICHVMLARI